MAEDVTIFAQFHMYRVKGQESLVPEEAII